jgi:hypothetical protein
MSRGLVFGINSSDFQNFGLVQQLSVKAQGSLVLLVHWLAF